MIFWDEPQTEADLARAAEQGRVATERQLRADRNATRRILGMEERPWCGDCGKRRATVVHYGRLRCGVCDPVDLGEAEDQTAEETPAGTILESLCAFCGGLFTMTPDRQRYCSPDCYQKARSSEPSAKHRRQKLTFGRARLGAIPIEAPQMYNAASSGALLKDSANR